MADKPLFSLPPGILENFIREARTYGATAHTLVDTIEKQAIPDPAVGVFERTQERILKIMESEGYARCDIRVQADGYGNLILTVSATAEDKFKGNA